MSFGSFLGNVKSATAVREMLASGRVPSALLFAGPDGVGKKTLALMLAKALNCERGNADFCGECGRCRKAEQMLEAAREDLTRRRESKDPQKRVEGLIYFDIQLIEPLTRYILTEQIRQLRNVAYTKPFEFPRRVFILDQAQAIHWQGTDMLLKVLEEPPDTTILILVCPNASELRPTIRSRCMRIQFFPVEDSVIGEILASERRMPKEKQALATRMAAGSVAKAKSFDLAEFERRRRPWLDFLEAVAGKKAAKADPDWKTVFDSTKALAEDREEFEETLRLGYALLRDLTLVLEGRPDCGLANVDLPARLEIWAKALGLAGIQKLKAGLDQAYRLQIRNVNQQLGLDALATELLAGS